MKDFGRDIIIKTISCRVAQVHLIHCNFSLFGVVYFFSFFRFHVTGICFLYIQKVYGMEEGVSTANNFLIVFEAFLEWRRTASNTSIFCCIKVLGVSNHY